METILILSIFNLPFGMDLVCCNFRILDFIASKCSRHDTPIRYSSFSITDSIYDGGMSHCVDLLEKEHFFGSINYKISIWNLI